MSNPPWDALEHHLAELLLADQLSARKAVPQVCRTFPKAHVSVLILAISSAASTMDSGGPVEDRNSLPLSYELYRASAMISADLAINHMMGRDICDCGALMRYWQRSNDPFFLT